MRAPEFWAEGGGRSWPARLLAPLGLLYDWGGRLKQALAHSASAGIPVICVGNLTAGGSGKTPVAIALLHQLKARGRRPFALTRGYGGRLAGPVTVDPSVHGSAEVGDEALLLAAHAPTIVARDRAAGARHAAGQGADVIVMDDGFQNPGLRKSLSLVIVDGETGFGNGRIIPAGPLREPVARGLARADAVIVMGVPRLLPEAAHLPVLQARVAPAVPLAPLRGRRLVAFAGIGRPEKFFRMLSAEGLALAETRAFPDHHPYTEDEIAELRRAADAAEAALITTEKDFLRLAPERRGGILVVPVHAQFDDGPAIAALVAGALGA